MVLSITLAGYLYSTSKYNRRWCQFEKVFEGHFYHFLSGKIVTFLLYPVAGLLAETLLTRYKVIMIGTVVAMIGLVVASLSAIPGTIIIFLMVILMTLMLNLVSYQLFLDL